MRHVSAKNTYLELDAAARYGRVADREEGNVRKGKNKGRARYDCFGSQISLEIYISHAMITEGVMLTQQLSLKLPLLSHEVLIRPVGKRSRA